MTDLRAFARYFPLDIRVIESFDLDSSVENASLEGLIGH
jgi:hypothetical protein